MARVHFKAPVSFNEVDYKPGTQELPNSVLKDWYFQALVKSGKAEIIDVKASKKAVDAPPASASGLRPPEADAPASSDDSDDEIIEDESEEVGDFLEGDESEESEDSEDEEPSDEPKAKKKKTKKKSSKR